MDDVLEKLSKIMNAGRGFNLLAIVICLAIIGLINEWNSPIFMVLRPGLDVEQVGKTNSEVLQLDEEENNNQIRWNDIAQDADSDTVNLMVYEKNGFAVEKMKKIIHMDMDEKVKIVAAGGSVTAGGGNVRFEDRYYAQLARKFTGRTVELLNSGHGTRNSFHGALFFDTFVPQDADIILWEFSLNDRSVLGGACCTVADMRYALGTWLNRVMATRKDPPIVILVYLWSAPIGFNGSDTLQQDCFEATKDMGQHFPFVLGHVNVANHLRSIPLNSVLKEYIADNRHPNEKGHRLIGNLIHNLIEKSVSVTSAPLKPRESVTFEVDWPCENTGGIHDDVILDLQHVFMKSKSSWKGWMIDEPHLGKEILPIQFKKRARDGSLVEDKSQATKYSKIKYGHQSEFREDRQYGQELPRCEDEEYLVFHEVPKSANAIHWFSDDSKHTKVFINGKRQRDIDASDWSSCFFGTYHKFFRSWMLLTNDTGPLESIMFCSSSKKRKDKNGLHWMAIL